MSNASFNAAQCEAALKKHNLNGTDAAKLAGMDPSMLNKALKGTRNLSPEKCKDLAKVLPDTKFAKTWIRSDAKPTTPRTAKRTTGNADTPGDNAIGRLIHLGTEYVKLPLSALAPSPHNPRKEFDQADIDLFAADIEARGLLQNLVVYITHKKERQGVIEARGNIVGGERRYRAMKALEAAGKWPVKHMPDGMILCRVDASKNVTQRRVTALAENMQRRDLTPLEEAEALKACIKSGITKKELAAASGRTIRFIEQRLDLLKLTPDMRRQVELGNVTIEAARTVAKAPAAAQDKAARSGVLPRPKSSTKEKSDTKAKAETPAPEKDPAQLDAFANDKQQPGTKPGSKAEPTKESNGGGQTQHGSAPATKAKTPPAEPQPPTCLDDFTAKQRKTLMRKGFEGMAPYAEIKRSAGGTITGITLIDPDSGNLIGLTTAAK